MLILSNFPGFESRLEPDFRSHFLPVVSESFSLGMRKLVKAIELDEKYLSLCSHLNLQQNQSDFFLKSLWSFQSD